LHPRDSGVPRQHPSGGRRVLTPGGASRLPHTRARTWYTRCRREVGGSREPRHQDPWGAAIGAAAILLRGERGTGVPGARSRLPHTVARPWYTRCRWEVGGSRGPRHQDPWGAAIGATVILLRGERGTGVPGARKPRSTPRGAVRLPGCALSSNATPPGGVGSSKAARRATSARCICGCGLRRLQVRSLGFRLGR